ncbi:MAG: HdeD family acid-resistance protein [Acidobacteriota bacterium]
MLEILARNWWAFTLRGIAALVFGILAILWPGASLTALVLLFGAYALFDGILAVVSSIARAHGGGGRWVPLLEGLVGIAAGLVTFAAPGFTLLALLFLIGGWAILTGILEVAVAIRIRKLITGEWALILGGVLSILFGVLLFAAPAAGAIAIAWWIGAYALIFGIAMIALSLHLRRWSRGAQPGIRARAA